MIAKWTRFIATHQHDKYEWQTKLDKVYVRNKDKNIEVKPNPKPNVLFQKLILLPHPKVNI